MMTAVRAAEGCLGATVLEPAKKNDPYHMVFRFSDALMLRQWERSEVRQQLRERADNLVVSEKVTVTAGSEEFFNALGDVEGHRTKWGKFVADVAWIYPVSLFTAIVLSPYIGKLDVFPRVLVSSVIVGATSKYATGPVRKWLRRRRMLPQGAEVK